MPPGIVSLSSLDDRFLFTSASMLVMALVAVAQWDALALDARDTAVLGVLPIPRAVIVRAKFIAIAVLAVSVVCRVESCADPLPDRRRAVQVASRASGAR